MTGHLIHIGYPKTGSNFLRRWFEAHPEIAFVEGGIAGCRDVYQLVRESAAPREGIRLRVTSSEVFAIPHRHAGDPGVDFHSGEAGDMVQMQNRACADLAALFPGSHVLIVTRGFRGIARSSLSQLVRTGGDPARFAAALAGQGGDHRPWDYDRLIGLYREAFAGRVIVLPYELLRDDAERFVAEIERRFGLDPCAPPTERVNEALSLAELRWYPVLSRAVRSVPLGERFRRRLLRRYLRAIRANRLGWLARFLDRFGPKPPDPPEPSAQAIEGFRGLSESLRGNPLYAPYADDYLL